jgi:hypothetical protein
LSERKPIRVRKGAKTSGSASIAATTVADTPSSTIITRFSVPYSITSAIPTDSWNSDSLSRRDSGTSAVATSAKGRNRGPIRAIWLRATRR